MKDDKDEDEDGEEEGKMGEPTYIHTRTHTYITILSL